MDRPRILGLLLRPARALEVSMIERHHAAGFTDVTVPHTALFSVLDRDTGTPIGVLAQRAGVTSQAMSQIVEDLVKKGYVERREDPNDRRIRIVTLTAKGHALFRAGRQHLDAIERELIDKLGAERFETLCELLNEVQPPDPPDHRTPTTR
jgi:DNA-binding MarR family transcriptional regulator